MPSAVVNGHQMYWEVHGRGSPVVCMGGWGTFCHGKTRDAPRVLFERHQVLIFDYRGIGASSDSDDEPSTALYARDLAALMDRLGWVRGHIVGMVGMGACVGQELAVQRPDLVRSLVMTGTWARCDTTLADQLELFRDVHLAMGFEPFQRMCAAYSFEPSFYAANRDRILGPDGAWSDLRGRADAHAKLVHACLTHDTLERLNEVSAPTLVLHAGADWITGPRTTVPVELAIPGARGVLWPELAHIIAGKESKQRFAALLSEFVSSVEAHDRVTAEAGGTA